MRASRRSFLRAAGSLPAAPWLARLARPSKAASKFDPSFGTATEALAAMAGGAISSRELVEHTFRRIRKHNPRVNAFVTLTEESALARAKQADEARAAGKTWGALHGLPILIKDVFETAGVKTTSGSKLLATHVPKEDAVAVARLLKAGAILIGKTNMPEFASDAQSYNDIAGTTNNPWDLTRTPGGSTGGGAAALAAGFGFLELGSDIGGSIRTPCHLCGIYGHKPTMDLVPLRGHIPPAPGQATPVTDLPVAGPMARSAADLLLDLRVIGGPPPEQARAYRWTLPAARQTRLKDYRIGYVLDDPYCPVTPDVKEVLERLIAALRKEGVKVEEGWPEGVSFQKTFETYLPLLAAYIDLPEPALALLRQSESKAWKDYARLWLAGVNASHREWLGRSEERLAARAAWQQYFRSHDAFLHPVAFVAAYPHNHAGTFFERTVDTAAGKRLYADILRWIVFGTLTGCPATAAPAGRTAAGLPVGVQILGPFLEDATPIDVAARVAAVVGGFKAPPGFDL